MESEGAENHVCCKRCCVLLEPWLDTSTPDPDTTPTPLTLRHQCQPTLGPTLRHQCQASVKPSRQWTSSYSVNGVK